jgi:hypothetical protein
MNKIRRRATKQLPSVLLTLLSIIQAIAIESLWERTMQHPEFFNASWIALIGWLQIGITLAVIVLIWLIYVALVMRFRWTPAFADSALPFVVGIAQFLLIELTIPGRLGVWCMGLGALSLIAMAIDYRFVKRARSDSRNSEFFSVVQSATWRDFAPQISFAVLAIAAGIIIHVTGHNGWFAVLTLVLAIAALIYNLWLQAHFWNKSMGQDDEQSVASR